MDVLHKYYDKSSSLLRIGLLESSLFYSRQSSSSNFIRDLSVFFIIFSFFEQYFVNFSSENQLFIRCVITPWYKYSIEFQSSTISRTTRFTIVNQLSKHLGTTHQFYDGQFIYVPQQLSKEVNEKIYSILEMSFLRLVLCFQQHDIRPIE